MSSELSVRRSPFLVSFWERSTHWVYNYHTRKNLECSPVELAVLGAANTWETRTTLRKHAGAIDESAFDAMLGRLIEADLLERFDCLPDPSWRTLERWDDWNPVAGFFHAMTKSPDLTLGDAPPVRGALTLRDYPSPLKDYSDKTRIALPAYAIPGAFNEILHDRRTWREFGERPLGVPDISALLGATFGVQKWLEVESGRWVALKTSPSGGAKHGAEAYLIAFDIEGIEPGIYHYGPDAHALTRLEGSLSRAELPRYLPRQKGFHGPAALVVMTTIFARLQWKYPHPHAYRVALLDVGHLGQTFALVATALGLAPFCTAAIDSDLFEDLLGIDGIGEAAMMAVGVGSRPPEKDWAPMHDHAAGIPATKPPAWAERLASS